MNSIELKEKLTGAGVDITSRKVRGKLKAAERQAQKETTARFHTAQKERITERIQAMLAVLAVFFVAGFLVLGNIATVIMFPLAEFVAVRRGIMAFESHAFIASFNAATIVIGYVVLLFVKNVLRSDRNRTDKKSTVNGLYKSTRYTIFFIQITIVLFGFLGRASDNLMSGEQLGIVEVIGYAGTLVLTVALLAVTDITVLFIYSVFTNNVGRLDLSGGDEGAMIDFLAERQEALQVDMLNDLLIMAQHEQQTNLIQS